MTLKEILPCDNQSFADLEILSAKSKLNILSNGCGATYSGCETTASHEKSMERLKNEIKRAKLNHVKAIEVLGDNL